jgi:hypothetical protein
MVLWQWLWGAPDIRRGLFVLDDKRINVAWKEYDVVTFAEIAREVFAGGSDTAMEVGQHSG